MTTHKLVPAEPTEAMQWSGWRAKDVVFSSAASPDRDPANCYTAMLSAAPNEGRVSREQLRKCANAVCASNPDCCECVTDGHEPECMPDGESIAAARAVITALGLEIEE